MAKQFFLDFLDPCLIDQAHCSFLNPESQELFLRKADKNVHERIAYPHDIILLLVSAFAVFCFSHGNAKAFCF